VLRLLAPAAGAEELTVTVDGVPLAQAAFAKNGVTYVALVPLVQALHGAEVTWDAGSRSAEARLPHFSLSAPIGQSRLLADDFSYPMEQPVLLSGGRTCVPLRAAAALLGATVSFTGWNDPIVVTPLKERPYTEEDLYWLSRVISAESRGEALSGQIAVGNVVLNRVDSPEFPGTIRAVVFDAKNAVQFEPVSNGTIYLPPTDQSILAARLALAGAAVADDCLYFFNPSLSQGTWIRQNRSYFTTIGCHRFYR